jgi:hypothetical protein
VRPCIEIVVPQRARSKKRDFSGFKLETRCAGALVSQQPARATFFAITVREEAVIAEHGGRQIDGQHNSVVSTIARLQTAFAHDMYVWGIRERANPSRQIVI